MGIFSKILEGVGLKSSAKEKKAAKDYSKQMQQLSKGKTIKTPAMGKEATKLYELMAKQTRKDYGKLTPLDKIRLPSKTSEYKQASELYKDLLSKDSKAFKAFKAPVERQFKQEVLPDIAERFAGVGAERSSAMQNVLGQAGTDLSTNLNQMKYNLMQAAVPGAMNLAQMPMQEQGYLRQLALGQAQPTLGTHPYYQAYQQPMLPGAPQQSQGFLSSLLPYAGAAAGTALGGPVGGAIGAGLGGIGGLFSRSPPQVQPQQTSMNFSQMTGQSLFG